MFQDNPTMPGKPILDAIKDDQDWRQAGKPPQEAWDVYKAARDPRSYRMLSRPGFVKILKQHGIDDPCPQSEQEWAEANPIEAEKLAKRRARNEAENRKTRKLIYDTWRKNGCKYD